MSNTSSDHLHQLIATMGRSEKRYFKLHIKRHGVKRNAHFEQLFDSLAAQEEYDEAAIIETYQGQSFVKRFAVTKNRLYNQVLDALEAYNAKQDRLGLIRSSLTQATILMDKGLYRASLKLIGTAERSAEETEAIELLLRLSALKMEVHERSGFTIFSDEEIAQLLDTHEQLMGAHRATMEAQQLKSAVFSRVYAEGHHQGPEERQRNSEWKKRVDTALEELGNRSALRRHHLLHIKAALAFMDNDHEATLRTLEEDIDHIRSHEQISWPELLLPKLLSNAVYAASRSHDTARASIHLEMLRVKSRQIDNAELPLLLLSTEMAYVQMNGLVEKTEEVTERMKAALGDDSTPIADRDRSALYFSLACIQLGSGLSREGLQSLNAVLNRPRARDGEDLWCSAQLLHLLAHIDLDNREYLGYALKGTRRQLTERSRLGSWEALFLTLVEGVAKSSGRDKDVSHYRSFVMEGRKIRRDERARASLEYFDYLAWAEHRLASMTDIHFDNDSAHGTHRKDDLYAVHLSVTDKSTGKSPTDGATRR